ncbi:glycoside hydrolase family 3 protein [Sulfurovum mangrovi]|uniref:glycoside hydrolase family 3 protein n=1 Tax=Sulfurovum mangrovi TaxID=2893889 RepID=UPI001E2D7D6D|nr:glycoside hydrolase family 3 N-terminal domain-containing protein [Sulfurovum mangrovi]UFH59673.1 glycosyl hydrolase [Sulfurovum mangrovi]UFH60818.1 glycosyl hydrolase [Sulfurovum mangrovi]
MVKKVWFVCFLLLAWIGSSADEIKQKALSGMVGQMLMVGFHGTSAPKDSQICRDIGTYHLGGVILFDYNPVDKNKPKNISSRAQVAKLTKELQACSRDGKLLIAVDQEGGRVQRLKSRYGFYGQYPKAEDVSRMSSAQVKATYEKMAKELKSVGINFDLAPVVDLAINPKNHVIYGLGRSFGKDPKEVAAFSSTFIDAMHRYGVLTSLKHFPGHGSSLGDTHKGFVDVTNLWQPEELEPYRLLAEKADTVMVAHVFNRKLDSRYPASLSFETITKKLRWHLGYHGVVITDDLQMGAISKKYGLKNTLKLAINAGNDILLFGNQLDPAKTVSTKELVDTVMGLVKSGEIKEESLIKAHQRIEKLKERL